MTLLLATCFQHQVNGIAAEMSSALRLSAFSSIVFDMRDYACGLFTPDAELIAQADTIPAQLGIMPIALKHMFEAIPRESWRAGDIIACNDPYRGCAHTMDMCLFAPVFFDGELLEAAETMGADQPKTFTSIILPLITPYMVAGYAFAFVISVNEFIISFFLGQFAVFTLPVKLFASLRAGYSPTIASISVLFILLALVVFSLVARFGDLPRLLGAWTPKER